MTRVAAAICAGSSLWLSLGTLGAVGDGIGDRIGLLPSPWLVPIFSLALLALFHAARISPARIAPLFASLLLWIPWLPFPVPAAGLLWTGPWTLLLWTLIALALVRATVRAGHRPGHGRTWLSDPRRAPWLATAIVLTLYAGSARWLAPLMPDGDAPHYLIIAQSIVSDGDIQIENNHRRGDYLAYSLLASRPDYLRRGVNGAIYSIHAPGLPLLIAPVLRVAGYPGVVAFLGFVAALSSGLVWWLALRLTGSASSAWFGWASAALTAPFFFQATQVFPDGIAATFLIVGLLPLFLDTPQSGVMSERHRETWLWALAGASLAILPWLQTRLAILAVTSALCLALRIRTFRDFCGFAALPLASAAAWFGFFKRVYGTWDPAAPYGALTQTAAAHIWRGLPGILVDQQFGWLTNAPIFGCILAAAVVAAARRRRWAIELLFITVPYVIGVATYEHWWGGASVPGRFMTPIVLLLGVAAARAWASAATEATRFTLAATLLASILIAAALLIPENGRLLINFRDGTARWAEWSHALVAIPFGLPTLFRGSLAAAEATAAIWIACALSAWVVLQLLERAGRMSGATPVWVLAAVPMLALPAAWQLHGARALTPARAEVAIANAPGWQPFALDFRQPGVSSATIVTAGLRIRGDELRTNDPGAGFVAQHVPAGTYRLQLDRGRSEPAGTLTLRAGDTPLAYQTFTLTTPGAAPSFELPTGVAALHLEADNAARAGMSSISIERVDDMRGRSSDAARFARRGLRYGPYETMFFDDNAYPEPDAFWVAGGRRAQIAVAIHGKPLTLLLRNAPVDNVFTIDADGEHQQLTLTPGEERTLTFQPSASGLLSLRIHAARGFRPVDVEADSRDFRYLGGWVQLSTVDH